MPDPLIPAVDPQTTTKFVDEFKAFLARFAAENGMLPNDKEFRLITCAGTLNESTRIMVEIALELGVDLAFAEDQWAVRARDTHQIWVKRLMPPPVTKDCPDCRGVGEVISWGRWRTCTTCNGAKKVAAT